jgi:hypothetical protein
MFTGAINADARAVVAEIAPALKGQQIYIGCSGNFTIERIFAGIGILSTSLHSNDVSLYSCAIGAHLSGKALRLGIRDERLKWLEPYLAPGPGRLATLLLATTALEFGYGKTPYHTRMWDAYLRRWPQLHEDTTAKLTTALQGLTLGGFQAADVVDFMAQCPQDAAAISFPPTYVKGYERLYKHMQRAFDWDEPQYQMFDAKRFETLVEIMTSKHTWLIAKDEPIAKLQDHEIARLQTTNRAKTVHVYSNRGLCRLTTPHQNLEAVNLPRLTEGPVEGRLVIASIAGTQLNYLRSQYLSGAIAPAPAMWNFACIAGEKLAGAFAFQTDQWGLADVYLFSDFAVTSSIPRLSKLILAAILSTEMQTLLMQKLGRRIHTIATTAFTDKPVSMKYRGLFELTKRKEGQLTYIAKAGRWTLEEGLAWWKKIAANTLSV